MVHLSSTPVIKKYTSMASLSSILNNDNDGEDIEVIQSRHKDFVFSVPEARSPTDASSSDIAIQTLHAFADMHHSFIKKEYHQHDYHSTPASSASSASIKPEPKSPHSPSSFSSSRKRSWDATQSQQQLLQVQASNSPNSSNVSRRDYKKKQLVVKPELMQMKQAKAAVKLGIPPSTFSKRWRESLPERKWPYRIHKKVEKSIQMLKVLQLKGHDVTADLKRLTTQRELNLKPAIITMFEDVNESFELDTSATSTTTTTTSSTPTSDNNSTSSSPPASPSQSPATPPSPPAQVPLSASDEILDTEIMGNNYNTSSPLGVPSKAQKITHDTVDIHDKEEGCN